MMNTKRNLKAAKDRKKIYAYKNKVFRYFKVGEHVFLKVKENIISIILGSCPKLAVIYCGPFEIFENIGLIACMLSFPASRRVHNVFHVSF
jgi:hypothetical protein